MRIVGLLGGMSWESTATYYRRINELVREQLGGLHSAECILYSVNFEPIQKLQHEKRWDEALQILVEAGRALERAGADAVVLCTNTMHVLADQLEEQLSVPLLHIADATGQWCQQRDLTRVALLGTRFTMEKEFYRDRLKEKFGIDVFIPDEQEREYLHRVIYEELCQGQFLAESKTSLVAIIEDLVDRGALAVILGCTEIGLLVKPDDVETQLLDTTELHSRMAVEFALLEDLPVLTDPHAI